MTNDLAMMTATDLLTHYRRKTLSPVEVTEAVLARIDQCEPALNAFCVLDGDFAMAEARDSEQRWQSGEPVGLLDGVPTTIKDVVAAKGWPTRRGSRTSPAEGPWDVDAPASARVREHGAVLLGKTTTPEYGWKGVTDCPLTGTTRNPWNTDLTPGGSSGGAAAACATGMGALHVGSDGGGSIRMPSAFTGVFGIKATSGRVPTFPPNHLGDTVHHGPMTRTVTDTALMLTALSQPDVRDWFAIPYDGRDWRVGLDDGIRGLRIAYSRNLGYADVDPEIADLVEAAAEALADLSAIVEEQDPGFENPQEPFRTNFFSCLRPVIDAVPVEHRDEFDPAFVEWVDAYRHVDADGLLAAQGVRMDLGHSMNVLFDSWDLLLTPQVAIAAFAVDAEVPAGRGMKSWMEWSPFTYPFNFTGHPAASVPCGLTPTGLPAAIQLVGPRYREDLVLRGARAYEAAHPFVMPPLPEG
tara:strand:- start:546 stop:1949 length:1404 start_codon:yes stop_codon:yes gene_type:complete